MRSVGAPGRELLRLPGALSATRLKVSATLDAADLLAIVAPHGGRSRVILRINLPGRVVTAEIAAKTLRRAQAASRGGANKIAVALTGDTVTEGLVRFVEGGKNGASAMSRPVITHGRNRGEEGVRKRDSASALFFTPSSPRSDLWRVRREQWPWRIAMTKQSEAPGRYFAAPDPPTPSEAEGMEWGRALARRYLPEDVRLAAAIAFGDSAATAWTRLQAGRLIAQIAGAIPEALPDNASQPGEDSSARAWRHDQQRSDDGNAGPRRETA